MRNIRPTLLHSVQYHFLYMFCLSTDLERLHLAITKQITSKTSSEDTVTAVMSPRNEPLVSSLPRSWSGLGLGREIGTWKRDTK